MSNAVGKRSKRWSWSSSLPKASDLLRTSLRRGLSWIDLHGYEWVVSSLLPANEKVESAATSKSAANLASACWFVLGDLHFVHDAPRAAISAYRRSHRLFPFRAGPLSEIGECFYWMGQYEKAKNYYSKALRVYPGDLIANAGLEYVLEQGKNHRATPAYKAGDGYWEALERLACVQPSVALRFVERKRTLLARRIRAMARSQQGDVEGVLDEWKGIGRTTGRIELRFMDWFYLRDSIWDLPEFWDTVLSMVGRFSDLSLGSPSGQLQGPPELRNCERKISWTKIYKLSLELNLARARGDARKLRSLSRRYPAWTDPKVVLLHLHRAGRSPTRQELLSTAVS